MSARSSSEQPSCRRCSRNRGRQITTVETAMPSTNIGFCFQTFVSSTVNEPSWPTLLHCIGDLRPEFHARHWPKIVPTFAIFVAVQSDRTRAGWP